MPRYIFRVPVEILRDEEELLVIDDADNVVRYVDIPINASTAFEARGLLGRVVAALVIGVQKGELLLLNEK